MCSEKEKEREREIHAALTHLMTEENRECVLSGRVADFLRLCAVVSMMPCLEAMPSLYLLSDK